MLLDVVKWLVETWEELWDFMLHGGYLTLPVILFPVLRKLVSVMKQFTN